MTMAIKAPRKKRTVRTPKSIDEKYMGGEPDWGDQEPTRSMMTRAYGWYNYFHNPKDHAKAVRSHYKKDKAKLKLLNKLPDWRFGHVLATVCRLKDKGCKIPEDSLSYFEKSMGELFEIANKIVDTEKKVVKVSAPKVSIQERIREQISNYIGEIEEQVDLLVTGGYKNNFNMYDWLRSNNVKAQQSNAIADYYTPLLRELTQVNIGKDPDLKEGYSHLTKKQLKSYIDFVKMIIDDACTWGSNQKTVRKTRAKKPQSVSKQVSNLKYQKDDKDLKLVSINPADIVGCNQLWLYDTKWRAIKRFDALGPAGLSVKGTTLQGFNAETAEQRKVRKPSEILPRVLSGGKRVLSKLLSEINTKPSVPNGRINQNMIILRAIK
jgi:hypothetical protein